MRTRFAHYQQLPNCKTNSTEVFLAMKRTSVWKISRNGLRYQPQDSKNRFFKFGLQEFASLALKKLQTAKLTPEKSSWQWKDHVCEKWAETDFTIDHKKKKTVGKLREVHQQSLFTLLNLHHCCLTSLNFCHYFAYQVSLPLHGVVTHSSGFSLKFSLDFTIEKLEVTRPNVNPQSTFPICPFKKLGLLIGRFFA